MGPHWLALAGCLCILATLEHSAAVPLQSSTQETLVVTKINEESPTTPETKISNPLDATTEEPPLAPIKLTEMDVRSEVAMRYAHTAVVTRVRNPAKRAQEATFRVLLPETAFISGFTMTLDGKSYKAYVKEKEEAKQIYTDAVSHGISAAHIATKARDSNHFTVSVNVEADSSAVFNLTYEELLTRRNHVYNHAINLHPGALVPKLTVSVHLRESHRITTLRVPAVRTGNEIDASENDAQNTQAVIERGHDDREATITFKPDLGEQRRLMDLYAEKSKESQARHSARYYGTNQDEDSQPEGVLGQFVVQYDVDRPASGEILVNDGYFVHFFAPASLPPLNKHVVFVLDTSGSMTSRKIEQLRLAMKTILGELNTGDYFSIVEFDTSVQVHDLKEADEEAVKQNGFKYDFYDVKPATLVPPFPATKENVAKAQVIVSRLNAFGGTNIASALDVAVDLVHRGVGWAQAASTEPASNDTPKAEALSPPSTNDTPKAEALSASATNDTAKNVAPAKDEPVKDGAKKLEPIIIFLTDGDPTVGETDPKRILTRLTEKNYGVNKASIFSLAFGEDADRKFLRKLSLRNEGFMRHIYEAADAALQLRDFYRQVSSPLLADVSFVYPPAQVKEGSVTKNKFRAVYAGSETVVAGRLADAGAPLEPHVYGVCGVVDGEGTKRYEVSPPVTRSNGVFLPLERLWAYLTIKQLLDERDAADSADSADKGMADGPEKKALAIALKYEFVTPLTSLVVVKPNATNAVNAESVDKPNYHDIPGQSGVPMAAYSFASQPAYFPLSDPDVGGLAYKAAFPSALGQVQSVVNDIPLPLDSLALPQEEEESADYSDSNTPGTAALSVRISPPPSSMFGYRPHSYDAGLPGPLSSFHSYPIAKGLAGPPSSFHSYPLVPPGRYHSSFALRHSATNPSRYTYDNTHGVTTPTLSAEKQPASTLAPLAPPSPADPLEQYHLREFPWVLSLRQPDSDVISVLANNKTVQLELSKDDDAPRQAGGDAPCARATDGAAGVCVYLTRCGAARALAAAAYAPVHCAISDKYAGVCCPEEEVDSTRH